MPDGKNNQKWGGTVAEWRGYMTAEIRNLKEDMKEQRKDTKDMKEKMEDELSKIKQFISGKKAVEKFVNGGISLIGGIIGGVIAVLSKTRMGG